MVITESIGSINIYDPVERTIPATNEMIKYFLISLILIMFLYKIYIEMKHKILISIEGIIV
ncbi:hypothetical protein CBF_1244 [Clostridium botulinum F str. 230613]|uniref:Uncharacterized protein n=1 Tax=Clostridium botulinum (strain Langeland / NCTC 10281 / Type F) TaxID=441772 RepID=A7GCM6_CLOBL|nr:hypothetical protein CLI_1270 [Clostridium botulinum F str. Langeland]ADF98995.1 hypothetical protein CBF_1244 [Clostridium botulinum F str. 230613]